VHNLGHTRSSFQRDHYLQTPDAFVRAALPGMRAATAIVHAGPATGAGFTEYTAEVQSGGALASTDLQRFVYVLEGETELQGQRLTKGAYAYLPAGCACEVHALGAARLIVIEKPYQTLEGIEAPEVLIGDERGVERQALMGDPDLQCQVLLPESPQFDFAVNTMTFRPGATLSIVEMHVMEHGLMMLEGGGIYRLGDSWYPVSAGDFIYMAPFCPQWFGALGKTASKYLLYKDWNRHPAG
jgi:(S)-ureidoglycine aminohydrolase